MQPDKLQERLENLPGIKDAALPSATLNAYLDNTLEVSMRSVVEEEIGKNEGFRKLYEKKLMDKNIIFNAIPCVSPTSAELENIHADLGEILKATLEEKSENIVKKVWRFLDTPII